MTFKIDGNNGVYDGKVSDESIKYGRNAASNHIQHAMSPMKNDFLTPAPVLNFSPTSEAQEKNIEALEKFVEKNDEFLNTLPPLEYEYRYMPSVTNGNINKKALLGAAYEEMGGVKSLPVKEFEYRYLIDSSQTAEPLDINKDGNIDIAEYGANILAADILSKGSTDPMKADGTINSKGMNAILEYTKKSNAAAATNLYTKIYNAHNLGNSLNKI